MPERAVKAKKAKQPAPLAQISLWWGASFTVLVIAIVATGTLLWALNLDGSIDPNLNVNHFMLFGALISSTDPIATLGILKSAGANPLLYDLIFGESALNDCIAIVVFHIFHDLACATDGRRLDAALPRGL